LEVRSGEKGDVQNTGRGAIEEAATQVLRASNGLVEFLARRAETATRGETIRVSQ
jgi:hypothetical protein